MVTWKEFAAAEPDLADVGRSLLYQFKVGLAFLAITHSQLTEQVASPHSSDRPRKVELDPVRASLDVGRRRPPASNHGSVFQPLRKASSA